MAPRALDPFEIPIADAIVSCGTITLWEFAAFLESPQGPTIEIRSQMQADGADPSADVRSKAAAGALVVVHHNHLSQESLSGPDWYGLRSLFSETFAHCADGTQYWGRAINQAGIIASVTQAKEMDAMNMLFRVLSNAGNAQAPDVAQVFRKEVLNRAMLIRGFVDYAYSWGRKPVAPLVLPGVPQIGPVGLTGTTIDPLINQAAAQLAPTL